MTTTLTPVANPLKLHHSVLKAATRRGLLFCSAADGGFRLAKLDDPTLLSAESWDTTAEAFEAFDENAVTFESPEDETPNYGRCGVMVASFHARYTHNPDGPGCNDTLDCDMRRELTLTDSDGKPHVDIAGLKRTGEAAGLWNPRWEALNPGMQRMNLANRIRGWLRNNPGEVAIIDGEGAVRITGRFGITQKVVERKTAQV